MTYNDDMYGSDSYLDPSMEGSFDPSYYSAGEEFGRSYYGGAGFFSVGERGYVGYIDKYGNERYMRTPSIAHIGKNMPSHKMLTRLRRNLKKHADDARTILKIVNPRSLRNRRDDHHHHRRYR